MTLRVIVTAKEVPDPELPASSLSISSDGQVVNLPQGTSQVINGFDENAIEVALRLKDAGDAHVVVVTVSPVAEIGPLRRALAMGADELVVLHDVVGANDSDSYRTAALLARAIDVIGRPDLILSGRQASDWDNGQVPLVLAELLGWPCILLGRRFRFDERLLEVERTRADREELIKCQVPVLVTVDNEIGAPRQPSVRDRMAASRTPVRVLQAQDIGVAHETIANRVHLRDLQLSTSRRTCDVLEGATDKEKGNALARALARMKSI